MIGGGASEDGEATTVALQAALAECQEIRAKEKVEMDGKMQDLRQKTKDHVKQLQERMQQVIAQKDARLREVEEERDKALANAVSASDAAAVAQDANIAKERCKELVAATAASDELRLKAEAVSAELRTKLDECEVRLSDQIAAAAAANAHAEAASQAEASARSAEAAAKAQAIAAQAEAARAAAAAELGGGAAADAASASAVAAEEAQRLRAELAAKDAEQDAKKQEADARIAEVVRKAREHVKQVQTKLEASFVENRELTEKHREVDEAYRQQQEKVARYKQLMAQANARIEESDETVRQLREALGNAQARQSTMQDQLGQMDKTFKVPPSKEEISHRGGILLTVETDENDDVWCLVRNSAKDDATPKTGDVEHESNSHWWLLSQLDVEEKPVPLQRRWRGEVSALRAQMQRQKKKSEDLQAEYNSYKQKANAALLANASQHEEMSTRDRKIESLGEQIQSLSASLQSERSEKKTAVEDLSETRRRLQEAASRRTELERLLDVQTRESDEKCSSAVNACKLAMKAERDALQQQWCDKERAYQQELDLRRSQKVSLDEEIEGLRARLASRAAANAVLANADLQDSVTWEPQVVNTLDQNASAASAPVGIADASDQARESGGPTKSMSGALPQRNSPRPVSPEPTEPAAEPPSDASEVSTDARSQSQLPGQSLPPQALNPNASVVWQDLVSLRSQVRQLELSLKEEQQRSVFAQKEAESSKIELRDMAQQQRLQNTVGQNQQMEYIRNIFRKFVEGLPVGSKEQEQLIPVLMTFFSFPAEDAKTIQNKRKQAGGGRFWSAWTSGS